ncbi:hypothetical protein RT717_02655 [Imperialibacter roseus]|uniref:Uncharacterized protein n=1 Tax=Imperialibacter roseus TaxID=1324217 RepID=A0ABZ0ISZ9_9BACT|nr:hypothetical protein [Imperialibacter roseus]WOK07520.1 hypothetical protein RT717_02655 [Imperialibacter roseus]|tara:strand:- start:401 stop:634 length:234 start_codon:yes stop_codon:yes gene_type:complete
MKDIIHQYYKKELEGFKILVQVNPESFRGTELIVHANGQIEKTKRVFDKDIFEDLAADEFKEGSPLEFNLYLKGLVE